MDKKLEKEILKMVYNESHFKNIIDSERPDFKLYHNASVTPFGVEITELYLNESFARLKNIDTYRSELIKNKKYRHKDDIDTFDIGELEIYDSDNATKIKEEVLIVEGPFHEDYINAITNTIKNKDNKLVDYKKGLNHINLTIFDQSNHLSSIKAEDFFKYFYHPPIRKELLETGFREILFITIVEESRRVIYPLKMLLFIAEFYFFGEFFGKHKNELSINSLNEQIQLFAELMRAKDVESYILNNKNKNDEIIWKL